MVASLFVYKMMVLPFIPENIIKNVDNIIREYLWKGGKSKIALKILQNPKSEGGQNLVNLKNKDMALKATWPKILYEEQEYSEIVYGIMRCAQLGHNIWRCNLSPTDAKKLKIRNQFWMDVLTSWCNYNYYYNRRIENMIIWYNSEIKIGNKTVMWNDALERQLTYVHQLFEEGSYKTDHQVWTQYGLTKLRFNSLKAAIPKEWKEYFQHHTKTQYMPIPPHNFNQCISIHNYNLTKKVYRSISEDRMLLHNKFMKWKIELGAEYTDTLSDYNEAHNNIMKVTNVTKYRSFQYRLLQKGLTTNVHLFKWGIKETPQCTFCGKEEESVIHLLFTCIETQKIWSEIKGFIEEKYQCKIQLTKENVIFNRIVPKPGHVSNFICLLVKQYIYATKCLGNPLSSKVLIAHIRKVENIEKYIAVKNERLHKHNMKWLIGNEIPCTVQSNNCYVQEYIENVM